VQGIHSTSNVPRDRSRDQRSTGGLVDTIERALPLAGVALGLLGPPDIVRAADALLREGLFGESPEGDRAGRDRSKSKRPRARC
jgi:hypothetical protein